uniref:UDP-galactose transporter n=1 Tax=Coccolithus braarudii TaxID=221442 RepID=A0A7S0Q5V3_9EUKA|mmetsp:Transcript_38009/g.80909  ORF Transcript_38009/g.80909 Transcript_38009/m.80909 type:complete len:345 (+) Transcript_38009:81-1115(+)
MMGLKLRDVVLGLLVVQTTSIVLLMHYTRTAPRDVSVEGPMYLASAAVFLAEALKLPFCLCVAGHAMGSLGGLQQLLAVEVLSQPMETIKCSIPALAYTVQGNLLFLALTNLDPPTYQVTYQTKTLFTALFSRWMLGRQLETSQWLSLSFLFIGTVCVSDLSGASARTAQGERPLMGFAAVLAAAILSAASSVYFEKMLKKRNSSNLLGAQAASLWLRNIQLGSFAMPLAGVMMLLRDGEQLRVYGLLHGFDASVWLVVVLNGVGGLLVAATMKYADNIVKCFAAALAIICSTILSVPLFDFNLKPIFLIGSSFTIAATIIYSRAPKCSVATEYERLPTSPTRV